MAYLIFSGGRENYRELLNLGLSNELNRSISTIGWLQELTSDTKTSEFICIKRSHPKKQNPVYLG